VSVPCSCVVFASFLTPSRDLSQFWVVDSACSINLTAFRSDFVTFTPPSAPSRVGGVGVDVKGSDLVRLSIWLASGQIIHRTIHMRYTYPTFPLALLSASEDYLVSVGCSHTAVVNSFFLLTMILDCSWRSHDWVC
jgi:hypothetical protein